MKRIFDLSQEEIFSFNRQQMMDTIKTSEGRTVMSETVISTMALLDGVSNPETARAFGADMVTLNTFDVFNPFIFGYDDSKANLFGDTLSKISGIQKSIEANRNNPNYIQDYKKIVGRFLGLNLEPVRNDTGYPKGMTLSEESLLRVKELGFDYLVITANLMTNVSSEDILWGIKEARRILKDDVLIIAGKMHGAGQASVDSAEDIERFVEAGADVILLPAAKAVPGTTQKFVQETIAKIHEQGALAMTTIGTSQEGASTSVIERIALESKEAGADIQHIGDAGFSGMAVPENITTMSIAIRGKRHTYKQMARSLKRG